MNGREAVKALMDGKKVRHVGWCRDVYLRFVDDAVVSSERVWDDLSLGHIASHPGPFEIFEEPLTDEQLISTWERQAGYCKPDDLFADGCSYTLRECARQLARKEAVKCE